MDEKKLDKWQKILVNRMIDHYECTSTYRGENVHSQMIRVDPQEICSFYYDDLADISQIASFEKSICSLARQYPVKIKYRDKKLKNEFRELCIAANDVEPLLYRLAGRIPKREIHLAQVPLFQKFLEESQTKEAQPVAAFCREQITRLRQDKNSRFGNDTGDVLKLALRICENKEEILLRELSIILFGETKKIEKHSLLKRALYILTTYGQYPFSENDFSDEREYEDAILAEYQVYRNPSYVNFNGNGEIDFENGTRLHLCAGVPVAIRSDRIGQIHSVCVEDARFMTVENLTSYNRMTAETSQDTFFVYLAGYHNKVRQDFLVRIREDNPQIREWLHFGDIDPDGFYILENLRTKTGIDFRPYRMGVSELRDYARYCRLLSDNDRKKADSLIREGKYVEVLQYMLAHGCKLEQEIVSLVMEN